MSRRAMLYQYNEKKFYEIQDSGDTQDIDLIQQKLINAAFFNQTRTTLKSLFVDDPERNAMYFLTTVKSKDFVNVKPGVENKEARQFLRPVVWEKHVRKLLKYFAGLTGAAIFVAGVGYSAACLYGQRNDLKKATDTDTDTQKDRIISTLQYGLKQSSINNHKLLAQIESDGTKINQQLIQIKTLDDKLKNLNKINAGKSKD